MSKKLLSWSVVILLLALIFIKAWSTFPEDWYLSLIHICIIICIIILIPGFGYLYYKELSFLKWNKLAIHFSKNIPFDFADAIYVEHAWNDFDDPGECFSSLTFVFTKKGFFLKITFDFLFMKLINRHDLLFIPWSEFSEIRSKCSIANDYDFLMSFDHSHFNHGDNVFYEIKLKKMPNFRFEVLKREFDQGLEYIPKGLIINQT